jgi:UDP-N-acetylglucosamine--N-acetylmuramyl-(pentapeptide) pyrophosphoryl-undecaprenol N-acetylglucosamine transferase
MRAIRGAYVAALATRRAFGVVREHGPSAILSVGGYASGPVTLAAALLGIPVTVLEPNSVVGLANRLAAPFAKRAYLAWPEAEHSFREGVRRLYGVPLRAGFAPRAYAPRATRRVLVMGGSQGAQALNERMPQAYARLAGVPGLQILHQAGRDRDDAVRAAYGSSAARQVTVVPFVDEVAREIAAADLVVARAGASTLAELTAIGRAAILVPFPHAADDHQARNGEALARAGAGVCIRQDLADPARLATEIERLLRDDDARVAMADASRACGKPTAAVDIAADLLALAGITPRPRGATNGASPRQPPTSHEVR